MLKCDDPLSSFAFNFNNVNNVNKARPLRCPYSKAFDYTSGSAVWREKLNYTERWVKVGRCRLY